MTYRYYGQALRRTLFQWKHFPADMVVDPSIRVPMAVDGLHLELRV